MTDVVAINVTAELLRDDGHGVDEVVRNLLRTAGVKDTSNVVVIAVEPPDDVRMVGVKAYFNWTDDYPIDKIVRGLARRVLR